MKPEREKELRALAYDFPVYDELFREIDRLRSLFIRTVEKNCMTDKEAAIYLGLSHSCLRRSRMINKPDTVLNSPPYIKMGTAIRYLKTDLDQWIENNRKKI